MSNFIGGDHLGIVVPYTTLFRSVRVERDGLGRGERPVGRTHQRRVPAAREHRPVGGRYTSLRSEEHTSEIQSHVKKVCCLLLDKLTTGVFLRKLLVVHLI